jgi:amino-acid N-acetyltransferase
MITKISIRSATATDLPQIKRLLEANKLPTIGIEKCVDNFIIALSGDGSWVGVAGLEVYGKSGLLRSVVVDEHFRKMGYGRTLVESILKNARLRGLEGIYLLTETAAAYFKGLEFEVVDRRDIPEAVKASPEFTECCETAIAMRRLTS